MISNRKKFYFNLKKLSEIDFIISDWIRIKKWLRSGPAYNYQLFDYIKEKLNFDKNKIIQEMLAELTEIRTLLA